MTRWWMRGGAVLLFAVVMAGTPGDATAKQAGQDVLNANFDAGLGQWVVTPPANGVGWAADNTPASVPPSAPNSLNYNNGVNFDAFGATNQGSATSPPVNLTGATAVTLSFQCRYDTETTGLTFDLRNVQVSTNNFATTVVNQGLSQNPVPAQGGACTGFLQWHPHTMQLFGVAVPNVQVRFFFNSVDGVGNTGQGWFVDNVVINAAGLGPPPAPPAPPAGGGAAPAAPIVIPDPEIDSDAEEVRNEMCGTFAGASSSGWMLLAACALALASGLCWKR